MSTAQERMQGARSTLGARFVRQTMRTVVSAGLPTAGYSIGCSSISTSFFRSVGPLQCPRKGGTSEVEKALKK